MKKVLFISPRPDVKGGISTVIKSYFASELAKKHRFFIVPSHVDGPKIAKFIRAGIGIIQAFVCIRRHNIDIVHLHGGDIVSFKRKYFYLLLAKRMGRKVIYHHHGAYFLSHYEQVSLTWKRRVKRAFESADMVICLSDSWRDAILRIAPSATIKVVPNAVFIPEPFEKTPGGVKKLTFLGLIGDRKGVFDLLEVIERLIRNGYNTEVTIGGNGEIKRLKQRIEELGVGAHTRFLGWISESERDRLLRQTDIFVLPSYAEGMPMSILEAMGYGIPIVSTTVGGIPELVKNGESGFLFEAGDLAGLYKCLSNLIENESLMQKFGRTARNTLKNRHDISTIVRKLDDIYQHI